MSHFEDLPPDWLSYEAALERLLAVARPTETETVPTHEAVGRVLAQDVLARCTLPAWDNSAMDGYAVRREDLERATEPVSLSVVGESLPGSVPLQPLQPNQAVRIMTGAPLPTGGETVIRVEHTDAEETPGTVQIREFSDLGAHVRPAGEDMKAGDRLLLAGQTMTPGAFAVALAAGAENVEVHRVPRVGILSSGDELVGLEDYDQVEEGKGIPDTNGPMLAAAVRDLGAEPVLLGVVPDDEEQIRQVVDELPDVDILVTTGGASMGEKDLFKRTLLDEGLSLEFWRAKIRPGSPFSLGVLKSGGSALPVIGLPGNPSSAFATFFVLGAPFLRKTMGSGDPRLPELTATLRSPVRSPSHLTHFFRVRLHRTADGPEAELSGPQGSGLVRSLAQAEGLLVVPEGVTEMTPGDSVTVLVLPGWGS